MRAGVDGEPGEQLAGSGIGGQRDGNAVDLGDEASEDPDTDS